MSMQAVGWLSTKLGINIGGRGASGDGGSQEPRPASGASSKIDTCLHKLTDVVFGSGCGERGQDGTSCSYTSGNGIDENGTHGARDTDRVDVDENGLPVSKNWYYFDKELNRWNVSPDAPQSIKMEFEQRLRDEEMERTGGATVPLPPPPPVQRASSAFPGAGPLGAVHSGQQRSCNPQRQGGSHISGPLGGQRTIGSISHRPQYALPDYFTTTVAPTPATGPCTQPFQQQFARPHSQACDPHVVNTSALQYNQLPQQVCSYGTSHPCMAQQSVLAPTHPCEQQFGCPPPPPPPSNTSRHVVYAPVDGDNAPVVPINSQLHPWQPPPTL